MKTRARGRRELGPGGPPVRPEEARERKGSALIRLRRSEVELPADVGQGLNDLDPGAREIDAPPPEGYGLARAEPANQEASRAAPIRLLLRRPTALGPRPPGISSRSERQPQGRPYSTVTVWLSAIIVMVMVVHSRPSSGCSMQIVSGNVVRPDAVAGPRVNTPLSATTGTR